MTEAHPYYRTRKQIIVDLLVQNMIGCRDHFEQTVPEHDFEKLMHDAIAELDRVLPTIPYVGGAEGRMTQFFEQYAGIFALGRVLRAAGVPIGRISSVLRSTFLAKLNSLTQDERVELGRKWLSEENKAYLRIMAGESSKRENPGDFVYSFVETGKTESGESFDFGLNYHECGFCKLCKANGDEDLLPLMCAMDEEIYGLRGIQLFRTTTIAAGDTHCNFRFRLMTKSEK